MIYPTENFVNNRGYKQLRSGNINRAIEVFLNNTKNYPNFWNVYDSLGEAYMLKGNKKSAIENYEKSIQLNPNNTDGKEMLKNFYQKNKALPIG
ncbi:MAG: tetratricopeptide repeat protein [Chryseobacterium sp.]|uniref:tetratricopeptide repeat protein n=1 Tax=Chryseobacterium sp. TaxID=1871047 RepID=UPI0025BC711D|nr:tetratricopeptide repeat protein [Chryseobacterium sp.]MCJ7933354.1 tetratricopeptide repeat protein [Chryseobacterium sp.]